jgi:4-hydroxybenzoate polyprenyltransferase
LKLLRDLKLLFGLSRTPHGVLDVATPALGALLCLGYFPQTSVMIVGLITAFAGYTAVYALNDLIDYRVDMERLAGKEPGKELFHVDEIMMRHPVAQGALSFRTAAAWTASWAALALAGCLWLNPMCALVFLVSALMEFAYCKLLRVTHWKIVPSAMVKASGGLAGVLAVDPAPDYAFVSVLLLWLAAWEVGAQNIANDIVDMEDDRRVNARTTATVKGLQESVFLLIAAVSMAATLGVVIHFLSGPGVGGLYPIGAVLLGGVLLIGPARAVYYRPGPETAASLFNKGSYVPASFLALTALSIFLWAQ